MSSVMILKIVEFKITLYVIFTRIKEGDDQDDHDDNNIIKQCNN